MVTTATPAINKPTHNKAGQHTGGQQLADVGFGDDAANHQDGGRRDHDARVPPAAMTPVLKKSASPRFFVAG